MRNLLLFAIMLLVLGGAVSCVYRDTYSDSVGERDATVPPRPEERAEEVERTEKTTVGPWEEKVK